MYQYEFRSIMNSAGEGDSCCTTFKSVLHICNCRPSCVWQTWDRSWRCSRSSRYKTGNRPSAVQPKSLHHPPPPLRRVCPPHPSPLKTKERKTKPRLRPLTSPSPLPPRPPDLQPPPLLSPSPRQRPPSAEVSPSADQDPTSASCVFWNLHKSIPTPRTWEHSAVAYEHSYNLELTILLTSCHTPTRIKSFFIKM